jgi:hypothetical protein
MWLPVCSEINNENDEFCQTRRFYSREKNAVSFYVRAAVKDRPREKKTTKKMLRHHCQAKEKEENMCKPLAKPLVRIC